jgi:hypothetical protein
LRVNPNKFSSKDAYRPAPLISCTVTCEYFKEVSLELMVYVDSDEHITEIEIEASDEG